MLTREAAIAALDREIVRLSFVEFLAFVQIRSDDPLNPTVAMWQPWDYLTKRASAWETGQSEVILKARQLGYTWLVSAYLVWRARNGWACAVISKGQLEARAVLARCRFIEARLPAHLRAGNVDRIFKADSCEYPSGGSILAFPSTEDAGVSFTLQLVAMDEFAFHPYGSANRGAITPALSAGGQMLILSTADPALGPSGDFHDLYWASKEDRTPYQAHFEPWHARPGRDAAWLARERAAFTGMAEEFDAFYPETDAAAFVARSGLVYPQFDVSRHVQEARIPWEDCTRKVAGVDWGGGDPSAVTIMGLEPARKHLHQYGEWAQTGPVSVPDIAEQIRRWPGVREVRCGADEPVAIVTLQNILGPNYDVQAADVRRAEGLGLIGMLLEDSDLIEVSRPRLTIDPSCKQSIAEFPGYRWATRVDPSDKTRYATRTPVDHHADLMDARRYAAMELLALLTMNYTTLPTKTLGGKPMARSAV